MEARALAANIPLIVIVGPTASGKTALAIEIAKQFSGEIICADSRTVYKGMNIGTAKPTVEEQLEVPHWGIDLVEPGDRFTVADFKQYALRKIDEIRLRGHIPFIVGGTGLYIDAVIFDYQFGVDIDKSLRRELEYKDLSELHDYCIKNNIKLPENYKNKRYVIRAIERKSTTVKRRTTPIENTIIVGIATDREILKKRISLRAEQIFDNGVVDEATLLGKKYGWNGEAMTGNIYPLIHAYLKNELALEDAKDKFTTLDWQLAKRQLTWFKRDPYIKWGSVSDLREYLLSALAK